MRRTRPPWILLAMLAMLAGGCGSGGGNGSVESGISVECPRATSIASLAENSAALNWDAGTDPKIAGYRVYYGTASRAYAQAKGSGLDAGNCNRFVVSNLERGRRYYFAVTAYDASGDESDFSNEASKTLP